MLQMSVARMRRTKCAYARLWTNDQSPALQLAAYSNDSPLPPQPPLGKAQEQQHQEDQRQVPQILGLAHGHAGLRKGNAAGEFAEVGGLPILSTGLGGEAFEQPAVLF